MSSLGGSCFSGKSNLIPPGNSALITLFNKPLISDLNKQKRSSPNNGQTSTLVNSNINSQLIYILSKNPDIVAEYVPSIILLSIPQFKSNFQLPGKALCSLRLFKDSWNYFAKRAFQFSLVN